MSNVRQVDEDFPVYTVEENVDTEPIKICIIIICYMEYNHEQFLHKLRGCATKLWILS